MAVPTAPVRQKGRVEAGRWYRTSLPGLSWFLYFTAINTIGRSPGLVRPVIWGGGLAVGLLSAALFRPWTRRLPTEAKALATFLLWSLTGLLVAVNTGPFWSYFRFTAQFLVIVALLSTVIERTGGANWMWAAFATTATLQVLVPWGQGEAILLAGMRASTRIAAYGGGENTLGWYGFLGILGSLMLLGEKRNLLVRGLFLGTAIASGIAVMASGSRGGFVASALCLVLWPVMAFGARYRSSVLAVMGVVAVLAVGYRWLGSDAFRSTVMSNRLQKTTEGEQRKAGSRLDLLVESVSVASSNPVLGVGLGQFAFVSVSGLYVHAEFGEILATTGVVGLCLYYLMYWRALRRMNVGLSRTTDAVVRYRLNGARIALLIVVVSGALFQPHFLNMNSTFLIATIIGIGRWGHRVTREARGRSGVERKSLLAPAERVRPAGCAAVAGLAGAGWPEGLRRTTVA